MNRWLFYPKSAERNYKMGCSGPQIQGLLLNMHRRVWTLAYFHMSEKAKGGAPWPPLQDPYESAYMRG
jgi:hypothetical protein